MTFGHTDSPLSKELADAKYQQRISSPSLATKEKWHKEFLESGAQYRMSYALFLKHKTKQWRKERLTLDRAPRSKFNKIKPRSLWQDIGTETVFLSGKFKGQDIGRLYKRNKDYFTWVLENQPRGIVSQQIVNYFNKNPNKL
jgi:hypothetical protein